MVQMYVVNIAQPYSTFEKDMFRRKEKKYASLELHLAKRVGIKHSITATSIAITYRGILSNGS